MHDQGLYPNIIAFDRSFAQRNRVIIHVAQRNVT